ncbi:hypothetical protein C8Q76DRAFT_303600 [Earliella scabrosa]|nr:hypothetical protein C8Q76DRAFT_303600 [Earliella scabrosa]
MHMMTRPFARMSPSPSVDGFPRPLPRRHPPVGCMSLPAGVLEFYGLSWVHIPHSGLVPKRLDIESSSRAWIEASVLAISPSSFPCSSSAFHFHTAGSFRYTEIERRITARPSTGPIAASSTSYVCLFRLWNACYTSHTGRSGAILLQYCCFTDQTKIRRIFEESTVGWRRCVKALGSSHEELRSAAHPLAVDSLWPPRRYYGRTTTPLRLPPFLDVHHHSFTISALA